MEVVQWPSLQTLYYRTVGVSVGQFYTGRKRREKAVNSSLEIRVSLLFFFFTAVKLAAVARSMVY